MCVYGHCSCNMHLVQTWLLTSVLWLQVCYWNLLQLGAALVRADILNKVTTMTDKLTTKIKTIVF